MPQLDSFDMTQIPNFFLIFQFGVIGLFVIWHLLMGLKRGVTKTSWFFLGNVVIILGLFYLMGKIQLGALLSEETIRSNLSLLPIDQATVTEYFDGIIDSGGLPLLLAIADLIIKILLFTVFFLIGKFILHLILLTIPWLFIKQTVKGMKKQRLIGGLIGVFRGAFTGFITIFPTLIILNTVVDKGVTIDTPEYNEIAVSLNEANEYNIIKYINQVKIRNRGSGDFLFDLAFRSQVKDGSLIIWRNELGLFSKGVQTAFSFIGGNNDDLTIKLTYDELSKHQEFIDSLSKSNFIDEVTKVGLKLGLSLGKDYIDLDMLSEEDINYFIEKIDESNLSITKDIKILYDNMLNILENKTYDEWLEIIDNPTLIDNFSSEDIDVLLDASENIFGMSIFKLSDTILTIGLKHQLVLDNLSWIDNEADKIIYINKIRDKIITFDDEFIPNTLRELTSLAGTVLTSFPGIDLDGDDEIDVSFRTFLNNLTNLTIILNDDPNYHGWVQEVLGDFTSLSLFEVFLEPSIDFGLEYLTKMGLPWEETEFDLLIDIIDENFKDNEDLHREVMWVATVYEKIANLHIGAKLQSNMPTVTILDELLLTEDGRDKFDDFIDTLLEGQTISALTNQMSNILIEKYVTQPTEIAVPLKRASELDDFNLNSELKEVINIIYGLYDSGFLLEDVFDSGGDILKTLTPVLLEFIKDENNKDSILASNIFYSVLDYNLTNLDFLDIPVTAYNETGKYEGWIKKSELSSIFDIASGLFEEMENEGVDVTSIMDNPNAFNEIFPILKTYINNEDNLELLVSSEIVYSLLSSQILGIDAFTVPETALISDSESPYYEWIYRDEIKKLLKAIVILDLDLPEGDEAFNLDNITGEKLNQVIDLESKIITRLITTNLKDANIFTIPDEAYTDPLNKLDLKQEELSALGNLLVDLDIDLEVISGGEGSDFLEDILVEDLLKADYENSYIIRGIITHGITEGLGDDIHELAFNKVIPTLLSDHEIGEIFKILEVLDSDPSMTLNELFDEINPETLSIGTVKDIINAGDSIVIRGLITKELLNSDEFGSKTFKDEAFHLEEGVYYRDLISQSELIKIVDALDTLSNDSDDLIMDIVSNMDFDELTLGDVEKVISKESSIIKTYISDEVTNIDGFKIHPNAIDLDDEIKQVELELLFESLILGFGETKTISALADDMSEDLSIPNIQLMRTVNSLIMEGQISTIIKDTITNRGYEIRDNAYFDALDLVLGKDEFGLLDELEITNLLNALDDLDNSSGSPIKDLVDVIDEDAITTGQLILSIKRESIIVRTMFSKVIIDTVTEDRVSANAYDLINTDDLSQDELENLFDTIGLLDDSYDDNNPQNGDSISVVFGQIGANANNFTIKDIEDIISIDSYIIRKYLSEGIETAVGINNVRTDSYDDLTINLISKAEITSLNDSLLVLSIEKTVAPNDPKDAKLQDLANDIKADELTPALLKDIANEESIIVYRLITNAIIDQDTLEIVGTDVLIPNAALESHAYLGNDITKLELINLSDALEALEIADLNIYNIHPGDTDITKVKNALEAESLITNRFISKAVNDASLDTLESHIGTEDPLIDIQVEELTNLVDTFIALGITDIDNATGTDPFVLFLKASSIDEEEFKTYIGYEEPYDPLEEDLGMTIVKDFLIEMLDDKIPNPNDFPNNFSITNREELYNLIYG